MVLMLHVGKCMAVDMRSGLKLISFSCSSQLSLKFILLNELINVEMPTIVGILTFEQAKYIFFFYLNMKFPLIFANIYEESNFHAQLS